MIYSHWQWIWPVIKWCRINNDTLECTSVILCLKVPCNWITMCKFSLISVQWWCFSLHNDLNVSPYLVTSSCLKKEVGKGESITMLATKKRAVVAQEVNLKNQPHPDNQVHIFQTHGRHHQEYIRGVAVQKWWLQVEIIKKFGNCVYFFGLIFKSLP